MHFFEVAKTLKPAPKTVALVGADAEFSNNVLIGARENAKKFGLQIVYDQTYPPSTVDFAPIVRAIQATNPDIVLLASYPPDSVGMVRAATEIGLKTQLFGGAMVGMQYASLITQLSEKLNRVVNYHLFVPSPKMNFPGIEEFLKNYQSQAKNAGIDPLGFYQPPFAYAAMQVLEQAIKATGGLNDDKLAELYPQDRFQHHRRRDQVQRAGRMGNCAPNHGAVPEHSRYRTGAVHDRPQAGHRLSCRVQGRGAGATVRQVRPRRRRARRFQSVRRAEPTTAQEELHFMQIIAAVARERFGAFSIEQVDLTDPRPDELLVKIIASGMCQTDQHGRDGYYDTPLPAVFGHEGAGVVSAVGKSVTKFAPGDHVVISFPWCGACPNCRRRMEAHCQKSFDLKMRGTRADGSTLMSQKGVPVHSAFFQQSSFATYAIANERFAVKIRKDAPLDLLGPFACSGQTGAGAVLNSMQPKPGDSFAVFGVGAVGLSGLMAASIAGCDPIIAVDIHDQRLALARELGATHTLNHAGHADVVGEISTITGDGVRFSLETSAQPAVFREAVEALMPAGACVLLGSARAGTEVSLEMPFLQNGRTVRGVIQGDSHPQELIPKLVDFLMQGKMPVDRMITFYPLAEINRAAQDFEQRHHDQAGPAHAAVGFPLQDEPVGDDRRLAARLRVPRTKLYYHLVTVQEVATL